MAILTEFKKFAVKGNVMDMAVGIIIGAAFGKIVASFVKDIVMPLVGALLGDVDFSKLEYILSPAQGEIAAVSIKYGVFIMTMVDFIIIAMAVFMVVRSINKMKKVEAAKPTPPTKEEVLLSEIRDAIKSK